MLWNKSKAHSDFKNTVRHQGKIFIIQVEYIVECYAIVLTIAETLRKTCRWQQLLCDYQSFEIQLLFLQNLEIARLQPGSVFTALLWNCLPEIANSITNALVEFAYPGHEIELPPFYRKSPTMAHSTVRTASNVGYCFLATTMDIGPDCPKALQSPQSFLLHQVYRDFIACFSLAEKTKPSIEKDFLISGSRPCPSTIIFLDHLRIDQFLQTSKLQSWASWRAGWGSRFHSPSPQWLPDHG